MDRYLDYVKVGSLVRLHDSISAQTHLQIRCDEIDINTGEFRRINTSTGVVTYSTGQRMRAAMTHKFGRDFGLGIQPWTENPLVPGKFYGNPSMSIVVSQYMISLRRRKVCPKASVKALHLLIP